MTTTLPLVFLLDLDNTLLDNDAVKKEIHRSLNGVLGKKEADLFWKLNQEFRKREKYESFPTVIQEYCQKNHADTCDLKLGNVFSLIDFKQSLFPQAIKTLKQLRSHGKVYIFTEGDEQYQRRKLTQSGIMDVIDGAYIYRKKMNHWDEVVSQFPHSKIVVVEDRSTTLDKIAVLSPTASTIEVCQGHYSDVDHEPHQSNHTTIETIADLPRQMKMTS